MRTFLHTLGGLLELARLACLTRFRFRGPYWSWRWHTAFGRGTPPTRELLRGLLEYARWVYTIRRLGPR